ncbi:hypothetical protein E4T49_03269 [Aureobasidium sp. EXF-10728]|nr:hypothetical protein E4T49_03269 [Aureobasidium sp. EXF-10728]
MKLFTNILALTTIVSAAATPNPHRRTHETRAAADLCGPLDTPMCCATDVLGVADLSCSSVPSTVTTTDEFGTYCAGQGKAPECCVTSLLGSLGVACAAA